jgi:hypothetical protein
MTLSGSPGLTFRRRGGWAMPYFDEVLGADPDEGMGATDAYLFGRRT